jgi:hypothetical protein
MRGLRISIFCAACVISMPTFAASWDESVQGDLSNSRSTPSALELELGDNPIKGGFGVPDLDYLAVTVPDGFVLDRIVTGVGNVQGLSRSFIGVQGGPVMTVPPTATSAAGLLGWTHYSQADGVDLLLSIGIPKSGSIGFTPPLPAGTYTFWFNETTAASDLTFDFNFHLAAAPAQYSSSDAPLPIWAVAVLGGVLAGVARRRFGAGDIRTS